MRLYDFIRNSARNYPDKIAVVHLGERMTYGSLDRISDLLAARLIAKGVKKGDRVGLFMDNGCEYITSYFGILKAGAVVVGLNSQYVARELEMLLNDCSPGVIIADSKHSRAASEALKGIRYPAQLWIMNKGFGDGNDISRDAAPLDADPCADNDLAVIIYTSGTTGKPKGVMLSHDNISANADSIIEYLKLTPDDKIMVILPFYYSYGMSLLTTHIKAGASLVIDNRFLYPNVVLDNMANEGVTGFAGVPSHYNILIKKSALREFRLPKLRYVTQAGGAMSPEMIMEFRNILPEVKFYVMYGQTEAAARLSYLDPRYLPEKIGSVGKAIPGVELNLLGEDCLPVNTGEMGEIFARGRNIMAGYWNAPDETAGALRGNWLATGDLARKDDDGFIYIISRKKEMIKSGANRISPMEIEEVVCQISGVLECAAVGVNDEILGEAIVLFVVDNGTRVSEREIMLFCKQNLAPYKAPKEVRLVSSLPKTSSGKIKRAELLKTYFTGGKQDKNNICAEFAAPLI